MKRLVLIGILSGLFPCLPVFSSAWAQGAGSVAITSPADGATLHGPIIELTFNVDRGSRGEHLHLYVDGKFEAIVKGDRYPLKGLPAGEHRIYVKLATRKHEELGPTAMVTFTVE
jgi:hypothetical protein